jgi:hypothetical protein
MIMNGNDGGEWEKGKGSGSRNETFYEGHLTGRGRELK